jgi:hypothetical protein
MPLRLTAYVATVAATFATAGGLATAAGQPGTRYFDIEANKAANMRALGLHMTKQTVFLTGGLRRP